MTRQTAQEIDQEAADWAAKVDRGLRPDEQSELDAWLGGDARRTGAFAIMRATALQTERAAALGAQSGVRNVARPNLPVLPHRRRFLVGGGLAAAVVGGVVLVRPLLADEKHQTRKGEIRQIALRDGSAVTLNTDSLLEVRLSDRRRELRLVRGEALFDIAHDKTRPFVVLAGTTAAVALGTSFMMRHLPGEAVQVLVQGGLVEVRREDNAGMAPQRLAANMRAVITSRPVISQSDDPISVTHVSVSEAQRALAWRDGQLAFEGETLGAAAEAFSRYSDTRIIVEDPQLAREEIAGLYQATDPIGFARSVAVSVGARVFISEDKVQIYR